MCRKDWTERSSIASRSTNKRGAYGFPFFGLSIAKTVNTPHIESILFGDTMNSFAYFLKKSAPLFQGLRQHNSAGLRAVRPLLPNRIKFIFEPTDLQVVYPGIYFIVPRSTTINEYTALEKAILEAFEENPEDPTTVPLNVPLSLGRKLSGQEPSSVLMNNFKFKRNKLYLESCNCVWVDPKKQLTWTSLSDPDYGEVFPLSSSIIMIQCTVALLSLFGGPKLDTRERVAALDFENALRLIPSSIVPELSISKLGKISLKLGGIKIDDFESEEAVNTLYMMLSSFLHSYTDLNDYMDTI